MIYQPELTLSRQAIDALVESHARVFHADSRVRAEGTHVTLYCADYFGDKYFKALGVFEQPDLEVERIKQLPAWQQAMKSFSAAGMVGAAIAATPKFKG